MEATVCMTFYHGYHYFRLILLLRIC